MRKALSISLLLVLLFNIIGYRVWFYFAEKQADETMVSRLDNNRYNEDDLVSISIPFNAPYLLDHTKFERVDGEINFQGQNFRFVKRKVSAGNLILLCIPDNRKTVLKNAKTDYENAAADITNNSKGSSRSGSQKSFNSNDYTEHEFHFQITELGALSSIKPNSLNFSLLSDPHVTTPGKPPQFQA